MKISRKCAIAAFIGFIALSACPYAYAAGIMTPYEFYESPDEFINGATLDVSGAADKDWFSKELGAMKSKYNINTTCVYGLENLGADARDTLFDELKSLDMKLVVRIESYDSATFKFSSKDLDAVIARHKDIIHYVSAEERRGQVAYFALNMPVDDAAVQKNLGGVNSELSKKSQMSYAKEFVSRMRKEAKEAGFAGALMYLSVFYGWDNSYQLPSYIASDADGYFINNYSYPSGSVKGADAQGDELINAARLDISMKTFESQYPGKPVIIECGFHTLSYNGGKQPGQTAGLVLDAKAKEKAMKAMVSHYKENYGNVQGVLYFAYNLLKEEGNPPAVMDWTLVYPLGGEGADSRGAPFGGAELVEDFAASGGIATRLTGVGSGIRFASCLSTQQAVLSYKAKKPVTAGFYSQGKLKASVPLKKSEQFKEIGVPLTIVDGYDMEIRLESEGELVIERVEAHSALEAENANFAGTAKASLDAGASNGAAAINLLGPENFLSFSGTRGGDKIAISYKSDEDSSLILETDGRKYSFSLPKSANYASLAYKAAIPRDADIIVHAASGKSLSLDSLFLSGPPAASSAPAEAESAASISSRMAECVAVVAVGAGAAIFIKKRKKHHL
jgi:hypothetical protein